MSGLLQVLQFIPVLVSLVAFIREAEARFRQPGSGGDKLQWVLTKVGPLIATLGTTGLLNAKLVSALTGIIPNLVTLIVQVWNLFGGVKPGPVVTNPPARFTDYSNIITSYPNEASLVTGDEIYREPNGREQWIVWGQIGPKPDAWKFVERIE